MKKWLGLLLLCCVNTAFAQVNCSDQGFGFQDKQIYFNDDHAANRIFILHNISKGTVIVNHMVATPPAANGGWMSKLDTDKWSALSMNQANFGMACMLYNPPKFTFVACKNLLSVCSVSSTGGGGWVAENMTLAKLISTAKGKGINLD